jgi:hypothetical protein
VRGNGGSPPLRAFPSQRPSSCADRSPTHGTVSGHGHLVLILTGLPPSQWLRPQPRPVHVWRRRTWGPSQQTRHRAFRDVDTERAEFAMNRGAPHSGFAVRHVTDEHADLLIQRWTAARSAFGTSGPSPAEPVAMPPRQRRPAGRPPTPCASSARLAPRRSETIDRHVRGAGGSRNVSSPSAAAEAPGSPRPIPDDRGALTPVRGRR